MDYKSSFELPEVASELVRSGVIQVSVQFTRTGVDAWARTVQSHPRLDVHPHQSFPIDEIPECLLKTLPVSRRIELKMEGLSLSEPKGSAKEKSPATVSSAMTIEYARHMVETQGLDYVTGALGVKNKLPADSLTRHDLIRGGKRLLARAVLVADSLSNQTIMARIATNSDLSVPGASDLKEWWSKASAKKRITVLSNHKKLKVGSLPIENLHSVMELPCPFRGTGGPLVSKKEVSEYETSDEENGEEGNIVEGGVPI